MKRIGLHVLCLFLFTVPLKMDVLGQISVRDSLQKIHGIVLCDTTLELADSVVNALRSRKFNSLTPYVANASFLKMTLDSMDTTSLLKMARIRYNYNINVLRKDYLKMNKTAKRHKLNLKKLEYEDRIIRVHQRDTGFQYAEIFLIYKKKDKRYSISFLAVGMMGYWFIHDQLQLELLI